MTKEEIISKGTFILNQHHPRFSEFTITLYLDFFQKECNILFANLPNTETERNGVCEREALNTLLSRGVHKIEAYYYDRDLGDDGSEISSCIISWKNPEETRYRPIPSEHFYTEDPSKSYVHNANGEQLTTVQDIKVDEEIPSLFVKGSSTDYLLVTAEEGQVYYHHFHEGETTARINQVLVDETGSPLSYKEDNVSFTAYNNIGEDSKLWVATQKGLYAYTIYPTHIVYDKQVFEYTNTYVIGDLNISTDGKQLQLIRTEQKSVDKVKQELLVYHINTDLSLEDSFEYTLLDNAELVTDENYPYQIDFNLDAFESTVISSDNKIYTLK